MLIVWSTWLSTSDLCPEILDPELHISVDVTQMIILEYNIPVFIYYLIRYQMLGEEEE